MRSILSALLIALGLATAVAAASEATTIRTRSGLEFVPHPGLEATAKRLAGLDPQTLAPVLALTGHEQVSPPIRVIVAAEGTPDSRRPPSWAAGYASGEYVVLMPSRVRAYPLRSLEVLLHHEVAHVLIRRATRSRPVPRWFNEGLALAAAREWGVEDRSRVWLGVLAGGRVSLEQIDSYFQGGSTNASLGYAISGSLVRDILDRFGNESAPLILAGVARDLSFEAAFHEATGTPLDEALASFWRRHLFWDRWVPVLTSSVTLWVGITLLALLAIRKRRLKDQAIRDRWEQEDYPQLVEPEEPQPPEESIH